MRPCRLLTPDGGFVVRVQLPPFVKPPEVVQWGSRVFVQGYGFSWDDAEPAFVEGMLWAAPVEVST